MKETGLMFKAPLVRSILDGSKTQTRRIAKDVKHPDLGNVYSPGALVLEQEPQHVIERACPYGGPGDSIYVRETWSTHACFDDIPPGQITTRSLHFWADGDIRTGKKRPAIHMPKALARIWLEITSVRLERLQQISEADAKAEGCEAWSHSDGINDDFETARDVFWRLWDSTGGDWAANPWVWVIDFKRIEKEKPCSE